MSSHIYPAIALLSLAAIALRAIFARGIKRPAATSQTAPADGPAPIGADLSAPAGTREFITQVLAACGDVVTDKFKLDLLQRQDLTIRVALEESRKQVESMVKGGTK